MEETIYQLIKTSAEKSPEAPAILDLRGNRLTYHRLLTHVDGMIQRLNAFGIGRNDRVAIVLPNGPEMATAFLSIACAASSAPLNPAYRQSEFDFYLSDLKARALVVKSGSDSPAIPTALARGIPVLELLALEEGPAGLFTLIGETRGRANGCGPTQPDDVALLLHTSGTTSRPKLVPLTQRNLSASAENVRQTLQLNGKDRCLNVMPLFHIHGLVAAVLASVASGASVVCTPGFYAPDFYEWLITGTPTWYTAVPTMHQAILARAPANQDVLSRTQLRFLRSSSASLPPQVMAELERTFRAPVIEAYGMTEAAHQMACNPLPPRQRKAGSVGPAAGPQVAIMAEDGEAILSASERGEIVIRGPNVTPGYSDNPEANARSFHNGWFRTGDQGYLDEDGYLYITGRLKEMINRGGEKITPREVDEVLLEHPGVAQAVTFAMPDPALGEDVASAVILRDPNLTEKELRRYAALRLADFKVPRRIVFLDEIPKGPTGKLQRIGLAERLGLTGTPGGQGQPVVSPPEQAPVIAPRTEVEEILAELWQQVLKVADISVKQPFLELGGDSILAAQLVARIREVFEIDLPLIEFFDAPTIAEQAEILTDQMLKETAQSNARPTDGSGSPE